MLGFEIKVNEEDVMHVASEGPSVSVVMFVSQKDDKDSRYMTVGGMDSKLYHFSWTGKIIKSGDKVRIRVVEIDAPDPVVERFPHDRETIRRGYYRMKKELEEHGLI